MEPIITDREAKDRAGEVQEATTIIQVREMLTRVRVLAVEMVEVFGMGI